MSLLDDLKAKADANGDGKIDASDLEALRGGGEGEQGGNSIIDKLKAVADQNGDGKLNLDDVKNIDLGSAVTDIKDSVLGN